MTSSSQTDTVLAEPDQQPSRFLRNAGIGMLVFVVVAFGAAAIAQPFRLARYARPEVIVHIVLVLGWLVLFIVRPGWRPMAPSPGTARTSGWGRCSFSQPP